MENEIWKSIPGFEGMYEVSSIGRLKSLSRIKTNAKGCFVSKENILKTHVLKNGYVHSSISKKNVRTMYKLHQLVAMAFLGHVVDGHKLVVNHKDFNRQNNRLENLEIVTQRENANLKHRQSISKLVGVCVNKNTGKWVANIGIMNKKIFLGSYVSETEAGVARRSAETTVEVLKNTFFKNEDNDFKLLEYIESSRVLNKHIKTRI